VCLILISTFPLSPEAQFLIQLGDGTTISKDILQEFHRSWILLDHNKNTAVSLGEAAKGLLSRKRQYVTERQNDIYADVEAKCGNAVPDGPVFVDCVVSTARSTINKRNINQQLNFVDEVRKFLSYSNCNDRRPPQVIQSNLTCSQVVGLNRKIGNKLLGLDDKGESNACDWMVENAFCRLSCRSCRSSSKFNGLQSRRRDADRRDASSAKVPVLISSDWHVEPWYFSECQDRVARYSNPTLDNMWTCFASTLNGNILPTSCFLNGMSDPPISFVESHFESFFSKLGKMTEESRKRAFFEVPDARNSSKFAGMFFFSGDAQTHDFSGDDIGSCDESIAISYLMSRVISTITTYFDADDIFLCPGNNDGPHNAIFASDLETDPQTEAWSDVVVKAGIVNNDLKIQYNYSFDDEKTVTVMDQVGFFQHTGYYIKKVDPNNKYDLTSANLFVISYNTNLGSTNDVQQEALQKDLKFIMNIGGGVYLLAHHPDIATQIIPKEFYSIVKGIFAGHVHFAQSTDSDLFTQVPAISQYATDTAYFLTYIDSSEDYEIRVSVEKHMVIYDNQEGQGQVADFELWE